MKDAPESAREAAIAHQFPEAAFDAGLDAMQHWSGEAHLSAIASRMLVLRGNHHRTYPWSRTNLLQKGTNDASLAVVPSCAHAVHMEKS